MLQVTAVDLSYTLSAMDAVFLAASLFCKSNPPERAEEFDECPLYKRLGEGLTEQAADLMSDVIDE